MFQKLEQYNSFRYVEQKSNGDRMIVFEVTAVEAGFLEESGDDCMFARRYSTN